MQRRELLTTLGLASSCVVTSKLPMAEVVEEPTPAGEGFRYCLNTSTIMGQKVGLVREIEIASEAGFDGVEIWIPTLQTYLDEGGQLKELQQRIEDLGIEIVSAIGFAQWIVNDDKARAAGLEQAAFEMDMLAEIGCTRIAAPPAGATEVKDIDLNDAAVRFRALLELGLRRGVTPQLEVWGFSANLSTLSEVLYVAAAVGHEQVRILPDVYHLYKGGTDFHALKLLNPKIIELFHINDYPSQPARSEIADKDRVLPGKGVAPMARILQDLDRGEEKTILSLEVFNRDYWKEDPFLIAQAGLKHMKAEVALMNAF